MNKKITERTKKVKQKKAPPLLRNWILPIASVIAAVVLAVITFFTLRAMDRGNEITDTANLLYIHNALQIREDAVISITKELEAAELFDKIKDEKHFSLKARETEAIYALVKTYEFACQQYLSNKLDREAFKLFYRDRLKNIFDRYDTIDSNKYTAIRKVNEEWR